MNIKNSFLFLIFLSVVAFPASFAKPVKKRTSIQYKKPTPKKRRQVTLPALKKAQKKKKRFRPVVQPTINSSSLVPKIVLEKKPVIKQRKKRLVIFSSTGGGGHTAVSGGLKTYLKNEYDVTVINVFQDVLASVDTLGTITFGKVGAEDFYNFCLRVRWTNVVAGFTTVGSSYMTYRQSTLEKLFLDYFQDEKPDLIISVMPYINAAALKVAERLNIPFLVITNDLDTTTYIYNICAPAYKKFRYTIAFDDPAIREKIKKAEFSKDQLVVSGFPLRPDFFKKKDKEAIKKDFNVPEDKPVVMVFMGGAGSLASYRYVRTLTKMQLPMHILVCLGRNERLRRNINKILLPEYVTLTIIGFTDRIADLMAISDVLITKPGPGSVCEALESEVPMILDQTGGTIWWEELNVTFMVDHGFAESLTNYTDLSDIFPKYIKDQSYTSSVKKKMQAFKRQRFDQCIHQLIKEMVDFSEPEVQPVTDKESLKYTESQKILASCELKNFYRDQKGASAIKVG